MIYDTDDKEKRNKLINIVSHDVERIERLITDYSQMLKDEVVISTEKMQKIDIKDIASSVVDDFNNIYNTKRNIKIITLCYEYVISLYNEFSKDCLDCRPCYFFN